MSPRDWWNLIRGVPSEAGRPLPNGRLPPQMDAEYAMGGFSPSHKAQPLLENGLVGARWDLAPFSVETYVGDGEPRIEPYHRRRFITWQPVCRTDVPRGWWRFPLPLNARQHGVTILPSSSSSSPSSSEYWKRWSSHAQRHRRRFLKNETLEIVEPTMEEYAAAYHATGKLPFMRNDFVRILKRRRANHGERLRLIGAREKATGRLLAGLAVLDLPNSKQSVHVAAFFHRDASRTGASYGLIDEWFRRSIAQNLHALHFGLVWYPGDPGSWKGYSAFKRQFDLTCVVYPNALVKIVRRG
ncbi:hypothetical protein A2856_00765 [Candidatus Uhrbacteria bacterium RIFCSPHIGHO2_01_FULL_63_20]|uniref:BioF2-like acetyltransferase domain-containing protein n=1 Tax=Candidatus Uhrbacteria bacterium RIFCSPHIGHO2_01_FULL_63_20 TaxID=1802385 RepID=A0A1F7TM01_9BACT|nr:MAG: hypothetical protein A2856_00765 [Candidatus Uhrbacteria bacterium RIFCSPHIGHO2_01_FULL_63_20]